MPRSLLLRLALAATLPMLAGAAVLPVRAAIAQPGPIELFFETPYLAKLPNGTQLSYDYAHTTARKDLGDSFDEKMQLTLTPAADDASKQMAKVDIRRGNADQGAGPFPALSNPLTLVLMEREAKEITDLSKGSPFYIRNRLRTALGEATVEPASFDYDGKSVAGWKMSMVPFAQDPHKQQLAEIINRRYEFLFSDAVPGGLYAIRVVTPPADGGANLIETKLTLIDGAASSPAK
ncbi:hypothetical protein [Ancylobacter sp. Lp-2]|uniref:hypothetical protein n=1 Tax=Ancylobacter sp. Lp-2 TaxID=2881339 RepID=UPI001E55A193|nr:hypothetical protein [Ancylobacter sp. Lp-2]